MMIFNIHIYREMRLMFGGIEAETPNAAAAIARDKSTEDADSIDDCNGETLAALVDIQGDEEYEQSRFIDFEGERLRKAAWTLLAALEGALYVLDENIDGFGPSKETAIADAQAAIAQANAAGMTSDRAEIDVPALLAGRRQIASIWSIGDVQSVRPDLTDGQAWEVLQAAERQHDASVGITWEVLRSHADWLFGDVPATAGNK